MNLLALSVSHPDIDAYASHLYDIGHPERDTANPAPPVTCDGDSFPCGAMSSAGDLVAGGFLVGAEQEGGEEGEAGAVGGFGGVPDLV